MRTRTRIALGALTAALVLATAVGTAGARRIETTSQFFRTVWSGENELTFREGGAEVVCEVTIEGSFHSRTISKVCGQLVGYVTRAIVNHGPAHERPCRVNNGWALNGTEVLPGGETAGQTLPWHIQYQSFSGTLPRIEKIRLSLINAGFLVEVFGVSCLYKSTQASPMFGELLVAAGVVNSLRVDEAKRIPRFEGGILCPASGALFGTGAVTVLNSTSKITIRLVQ